MPPRSLHRLFRCCITPVIFLVMAGGPYAAAQLSSGISPRVHAEEQDYSAAEYRQFEEAAAEKNAQHRIALLDAFVVKYPGSKLMPRVLSLYYPAYMELKNDPKAFEYADKLLMLGEPLGLQGRLQALYVRCKTFPYVFDPNAADASQQLTKNRYDALEAVGLIANLTKPSGSMVSDADFLASKMNMASEMLDLAADADLKLNALDSAEKELRASLANSPGDGWADVKLGLLDLNKTPAEIHEGFWLLARAIPLRPDAGAAIRNYLRNLILAYQHSNCSAAAESEMNDLVRLASSTPQRPSEFPITNKLSPEQEKQCAPAPPAALVAEAKTENAVPVPNVPAPKAKKLPAAVAPPVAKAKTENVPLENVTNRGLAPEEPSPDAPAVASTGRYYALVIGINDYLYAPKLRTAVLDAQAVAAVLRDKYGFETRSLTNATRRQIIQALSDYRRTLDENANLLVYYAGHGVYDKDADKTYWLPADAEAHDTTNWIIADEITTDIKVIPARHVLIISDSCYSGGITRSVDLAFTPQERGRYLEKMMKSKSRTLMASGGLEPVSDEGAGGHSVFANALLRGLQAEDDAAFSAENLFEEFIRVSVAGQSDQTPQYNAIRNSGHDAGDFVFVRSHLGNSSH